MEYRDRDIPVVIKGKEKKQGVTNKGGRGGT
jgi:hypothetical protein